MARRAIAALRLTPSRAAPGEPVLVEAIDEHGAVLDGPDVVIDGIAGARQWRQFAAVGTFDVLASTRSAGAAPGSNVAASVTIVADDTIEGRSPRRMPLLRATRHEQAASPYVVAFSAIDTDHYTSEAGKLFANTGIDLTALEKATSVTAWEWDFGTGSTLRTVSPAMEFDFSAHLRPDEPHRLFDVTCTLAFADGTTSRVARTISVVNAYAVCRELGVMAPRAEVASMARKQLRTYRAQLRVHHPEADPLTVDIRRFRWDDEAGESHQSAWEPLPRPVTLSPNRATLVDVEVSFDTVPANVRSFGVEYAGRAPTGHDVHVEALVDVALPDYRSAGEMLGRIAVTNLRPAGLAEIIRKGRGILKPDPIDEGWSLERIREISARELDRHPAAIRPNIPGIDIHQITGIPDLLGASKQPEVHFGSVEPMQLFSERLTGLDLSAIKTGEADERGEMVDLGELDADEVRRRREIEAMIVQVAPSHPQPDAPPVRAEGVVPVEGSPCDPQNLPGAADGWACQVKLGTDKKPVMVEWSHHARFVNARKGDLVLAPGGPAGLIGGLLAQVQPSQRYAHIGIMTRNHDLITHCTFSEERLLASGISVLNPLIGGDGIPTDGFDPDTVRYGWPGTITQWVKGAIHNGKRAAPGIVADPNSAVPGAPEDEAPMVTPEGVETDKVKPFDPYPTIAADDHQRWQIIPPLVVKPHPRLETAEIRAALHRLADACRADTDHTYYSFYGYTDARRALIDRTPPSDGWPSDCYPAVCSSMLWSNARRLGMHLAGDGNVSNPQDLPMGGTAPPLPADTQGLTDPTMLDGLSYYDPWERAAAAKWLNIRLREQVLTGIGDAVRKASKHLGHIPELVGDLLDAATDIASDVANQVTNAFASDWCDSAAKDSERWAEPGPGLAVSPDDTMGWVGPDRGGYFGFTVPAIYEPERKETAPSFAWHLSPTTGTVRGIVRFQGQPKAGAVVQLNDSLKMTAWTGRDGRYRIEGVPLGWYPMTVEYFGSADARERRDVEITAIESVADFELGLGPEVHREIRITGSASFMKYYVVGRNPRGGFDFEGTCFVEAVESTDSMAHAPFDPTRPDSGECSVPMSFHGIYGKLFVKVHYLSSGRVQWRALWRVAQDAHLLDRAAWAVGGAFDSVTIGFVDDLFGPEVKGDHETKGEIERDRTADVSLHVGAPDRTNATITFRIENLQA